MSRGDYRIFVGEGTCHIKDRPASTLIAGGHRLLGTLFLARGDAPQDAAELARRSQLDLTEVPDAVRARLGSMFAEGFDTIEEAIAAALQQYGDDATFLVIPHASDITPLID